MLVAEVDLDGCGLWFGEEMVDAVSLQRGSADMDISCSSATPVQPQAEAELGQLQLTVLSTLSSQDK